MRIRDRQYDPGHWLGGNIDPLYRARRPNRWGYCLYVVTLFCAFGAVTLFRAGEWGGGILFAAWGLLNLVAGAKLLRRPLP